MGWIPCTCARSVAGQQPYPATGCRPPGAALGVGIAYAVILNRPTRKARTCVWMMLCYRGYPCSTTSKQMSRAEKRDAMRMAARALLTGLPKRARRPLGSGRETVSPPQSAMFRAWAALPALPIRPVARAAAPILRPTRDFRLPRSTPNYPFGM